MSSFYDLSDNQRFMVYGALKALDCETGNSGGGGRLCVAVAKGKLGELIKALTELGLSYDESYYFPLGSDKPPMQLRHDSEKYGSQACNWFYAMFSVKEVNYA